MRILGIDIETYSSVDLSQSGMYRYAESDDFEILLFGYAFDDEEVRVIDLASGEKLPEDVITALEDPDIIKCAWNAQFERTCIGRYLGHTLDPDQWRCSMVHAAELSLPLHLKDAASVLKTIEQKDRSGEMLIRKFSVPRSQIAGSPPSRWMPEDDPAAWEMFKAYNAQDVRTERDIRHRLEKHPLPAKEWDFYHMDQRINDLGVRIDKDLVREAIECDRGMTEKLTKRAREITGLENPNSVLQLKGWFRERGIYFDTMGSKDVERVLCELKKDHGTDDGRMPATESGCIVQDSRRKGEAVEMLSLRQQMSKSSVRKYQAAERCVCSDGRVRGMFQFAGAGRTSRWSGRHLQLHNLRRNDIPTLDEARELVKSGYFDMIESIYGNTQDILSQLVRTMLVPEKGYGFVVADFSAIEARVLAWEAGEKETLKAFREGKDLYCSVASSMFGVPVEKHGINGELRQKGKIATLACGYQGGVGALIAMGALDMGLTEKELPEIIRRWRDANPHIVRYWHDIENAAKETVTDHLERRVRKVRLRYQDSTLWMILPSGRKLAYIHPKLKMNRFGSMTLTFEGIGTNGHWTRQETYGGRLVENATQAIARDILAEAMLRMQKAGLRIVGHVHDEVIAEIPDGTWSVDEVSSLMSENPAWCMDCPLRADGYSALHYYYKT